MSAEQAARGRVSESLRALIVEDCRQEADQLVLQLRESGLDVEFERVETRVEMRRALERCRWDVVISDYSLPAFSALDALDLLEKTGGDVPLILVCGRIGEDAVARAMKHGVRDFVPKESMGGLGPAVRREVEASRTRLDRRRAEQTLRESEARFRATFDRAGIGMAVTDMEGRILETNSAFRRMLGYSREELWGVTSREITHPDDWAEEDALAGKLISGEIDRYEMEKRFNRKDGSAAWSRLVVTVVRGDRPIAIGMVEDISEQKRAEAALRESEERLRRLADNMLDMVGEMDAQGVYRYVSPSHRQMLGYELNDLLGTPVFERIHPDDRPLIVAQTAAAIEAGVSGKAEFRYLHASGRYVWLEIAGSPLLGREGQADGAVFAARDVTDRKRAEMEREEALQQLSGRVRELTALHRTAALLQDESREIGIVLKQVAGVLAPAWTHADVAAVRVSLDGARFETDGFRETPWMQNVTFATAGGSRGSIEVAYLAETPARDVGPFLREEGVLLESVAEMLRSFLDRRQARQALRESEALLSRVAQGSRSVAFRYEMVPARRYSYVSSGVSSILGYSPEEFYEAPWIIGERLASSDDLAAFKDILLGKNQDQPANIRVRHKDGSVVWVEMRVQPVHDAAGNVVAREGTIRDISDHKLLEAQLLRAQRLEAAGRIAAQVAHDFNNLLVPVAAYPELIKLQLPDGHAAIPYCDAIVDAAQQMAAINEDMLALGRRGYSAKSPVNLSQLLGDALARMPGFPEGLEVQLELCPNLLPIAGSGAQLLRVLTNLISNAREALEDRGKIRIATQNVLVDDDLARHNGVTPGEYALLTVADTGPGIPPEIRGRIFDAFFTTKSKAQRPGTGLGLSIVQAIVDDHKGFVEVDTGTGRGTAFKVYLPAGQESGEQAPIPEIRGGSERLLVVDDDAGQRDVLKGLLSALGYRVAVAASGEQAIAEVAEDPADLVLLDMMMPPGIDGAETYRRMLAARPGQKAIILSGYAESARVVSAQKLGPGAFLRKPVTLAELATAVRRELDCERAGDGSAAGCSQAPDPKAHIAP